jgi:YfiH family protein
MGFAEHSCDGLVYLTAASFDAAGGVRHGFTTRFGGVSEGKFSSLNLAVGRGDERARVLRNYDLVCGALGISAENLVFSAQVHGEEIRAVSRADAKGDIFADSRYRADALITNERGVPLIIFVADCIPILLYDPVARAVGAVHAGWRGTVLDIAGKTARRLQSEYGARPETTLAAVGAGIGACCFETGTEVPDAVRALAGIDAEAYIQRRNGRDFVDLKGVNRTLLLRAGLRPENISVSDECVMCQSDKYWSHRATRGERGAQAGIVQLTIDN